MSTPSTGIPYVPQNVLDPAAGINKSFDHIDALLQSTVISMALNSPPSSPADGDQYIVGSGASGAWAGHADDLARYVSEGSFWQFFVAGDNVRIVLNEDDGGLYAFIAGNWVAAVAGSASLLTVIGLDSSPISVVSDVETITFEGATVVEDTGGVARVVVSGGGGASPSHGTIETLTISSNTITLDLSASGIFEVTLTANVNTVNFSNLTNGDANFFTLRVAQDGTGGRTFAVPASWKFADAIGAYVVSAAASAIDLIQGISYDDGTTWLVSYLKDFG